MAIRRKQDKREKDKQALQELAFVDDLTSLYNRRYLYQYLPGELKRLKQTGKRLCLLMMDVDNFKEINDAYGHLSGDKVLVGITQILNNNFRQEDTLIRYAGDEFVAILPETEEKEALNLGRATVKEIDAHPFRGDQGTPNVHVTLSVGLAVFPGDAHNPEKLIEVADRALYSSKMSGRNRICAARDVSTEVTDERRLQEIFPCPQLIGREREIGYLKSLLDQAEKGESRFALIKGERGAGKTRLLNELEEYAQEKGIANINVSCSPEISNQPYQILIQALESLFTSLGGDVREFIRSLPEAQTAQLANYIAGLKQFLPEGFKGVKTRSEQEAQVDLFKGISQSLVYVVKRNTLVLIVDDFHWIDSQTLQLFNHIIAQLRNIPLFIVAAYRPEEWKGRSESESMEELLTKMQQEKLITEVALAALEKEQVSEMIMAIFKDIKLRPEFIEMVYNVSAGNLLFTEEVLRALVSKGFIFYQDRTWRTREISEATLPLFLKEAIQKRLTDLDEETRPVISAAAVIGEVFDFDVLCQVLDKDPGYILEIIDRAAKQHLVVPKDPLQSDKFTFNSGATRDIVYTSISPKEKQDLHRRLALIEENIYKDNIGSVAASLGYHFGKAQDAEKTNLYGKMLLEKVNRMPTYEDVFGYLQEALLERAEEVIVPLSDAGLKLVPQAMRSLRLAAQNVRLYPPQSSIREGFVNQAYQDLINILAKDSTLIAGTAENRLLINGEEVSSRVSRQAGGEAFVSLMIDHRIKSITFKRDLTREHFEIFLEAFSQNYDDLLAEGGFSGLLRKKDVSLVRVNEVRYEQTSKLAKQRTKFEDAMFIDYLIGKAANLEKDKSDVIVEIANDPKKLTDALKQVIAKAAVGQGQDKTQAQANIVAHSLEKLGQQVLSQNKDGAGQYRKNIAQALMSLDYKLRSKLIQSEFGPGAGGGAFRNIVQDAVREFSDKEILEMVTREFALSEGNLPKLRSFLRKFMLEPKRKQNLASKLKNKLSQLGVDQEEASWVLDEGLWEDLPAEERVGRLIKLSPLSYIKLEASKEVDNLTSQLLEHEQYDQIGEIIDKLLKQLEDQSKQIRQVSLLDLDKISEMLIARQRYFLLEQIINSFIARLDREPDPQIYALLAQGLATSCAKLIKRQNLIQAAGILKEFNLRTDKSSKILEIQKQALKKSKENIIASSSTLGLLAALLKEKIKGRHDFWELTNLIIEIGPAAIGPIFALAISREHYLDPFITYSLRWGIAKVLKGMGEAAVSYLNERLADKDIEVVKVVLELLGHIQNKNAVRRLQPLLRHQNLELRKEAIATLGKIGGREAIKLLNEPLKDKNRQIHLAAIWALANIGGQDVLALLKPLLQEKKLSGTISKIIQRIEKGK